jgi:hypothetical protein
MILQSSSGYGGLEATPLARPGYYNEIIARVYERDFLPEITNSEIDERILQCNQQVQILKAPEVGPWRAYQKNQEMVPNQVSAQAICLSICNAAYNAIKIDQTDIHFACERWAAWEEKFLDSVYETYVAMQREWVLTAMILEASTQNKGSAAGKFGTVDLGSRGNPVVVDKDNIPLRMAQLQQVLTEQLMWKDGEMFVVMPVAFRPVLSMSNFANAAWTGSCKPCSFGIDGLWNVPLGGFNVIETTHAPYVVEPDGRVCFYVIAGHRGAFAYASDIIDGRIMPSPRTFGVEYQMLAVWGGKMLYPEAMAVAYWTFKTN